MFAQLGTIVFEPLAGFESVSSSLNAVIAQYQLIGGTPLPQQTGRELATKSLGMKLHQRFIVVKTAITQLNAYIQNAVPVALVWGNGDNDGMWIIQSVTVDPLEMDGLGNVFYAAVTVSLLEVPSGQLLDALQNFTLKSVFGLTHQAVPVIVKPVPQPPSQWQTWVGYLNTAKKYAGMIDSLVYSGITPLVSSILSGNIAAMQANVILLGEQYDSFGDGFADLPDLTDDISNVSDTLGDLAAIDPLTDFADFSTANTAFQAAQVQLNQNSFLLMARSVCRSASLIIGQ